MPILSSKRCVNKLLKVLALDEVDCILDFWTQASAKLVLLFGIRRHLISSITSQFCESLSISQNILASLSQTIELFPLSLHE
jgi:hypothetical protein